MGRCTLAIAIPKSSRLFDQPKSLYRRSLGHHGQPVSRFNLPDWNMGDEANSSENAMMLADPS
jgi:hypothetical protein